MSAKIVSTPGICGGEPRIDGTRVTVIAVLGALNGVAGYDVVRGFYPHLTDEQIAAAITRAAFSLRAAGTGEGEIKGYRVRIAVKSKCEYIDFNATDRDDWSDVDGKPKALPRSEAVRLIRMAREWATRIGSPWTFTLHPVRRHGGKR